MRSLPLLQAGLLAAACFLAPAAAAPGSGSSKWQKGPTTTAKGRFSWFNAQSHGTRAPADSNGDVNKKFMVVTTNRNISMFDMLGNPVAPSIQQGGPEGFFIQNCKTPGSQCDVDEWELASSLNIGGDARVQYDQGTKRWYITSFAVLRNASAADLISQGKILVAVSTSDDPIKPWRVLDIHPYPHYAITNRWWGDYPMLGFSKDKIVVSMNYFPIDPYPSTDQDQGIIIIDKAKAIKGTWSYQYIAPPPDAPQLFILNQTGFAADPAIDVDNKRKEAYLVSSNTNDPTSTLRVTTLTGLPPNVAWSVQALPVTGANGPVRIPQPPNLLDNVAGDGRVGSPPMLRATRVRKQGPRQLRLYASRGIADTADVLNGLRLDILAVGKPLAKGAGGLVTVEGSFNVFSSTDKQLTYPSVAVNKAGYIGLGHSVGDGYGMGAGLFSVNPMTTGVNCVPPFPGVQMNHSRWGDYSSTRNNPYCEGGAKGGGFCSFQMRGSGLNKAWEVMAGCYCEKAFKSCSSQFALTVVGGSFGGTNNVPIVPGSNADGCCDG